MNAPLRYVQIGVGGFGQHWCKDVLPRLKELGLAEPAAAVDINPEALKLAREQLGLPEDRLYTSAQRAVAEVKPDFVTIVVPPAYHEQMVDIALANNCHILSEKPIADTMEACCRIYHKVRKSGKKMAATMSHRFDQDKQTLQREVHSGRHGRLNYIVHRFTHNCRKFGSWGKFRHEIPDTLLVEGTVHHFDIFRGLAGADAATVYARTWNPPWGEFAGDSTAMIIMEMANGVRCMYEGAKANASTMNGWMQDYIRVECENTTLELDRRRLRGMAGGAWESPTVSEIPLIEQPAWMNPWLAEMFCQWVLGKRDDHPTALEGNIQCAALLFAAIESAHTGKAVDVQEYLRRSLQSTHM